MFERYLETTRVRYDFVVVGYVLMPEHVHLLLSEPLEWAWSSFGHYATGEQRVVEVESDWMSAKRDRASS